MTPDLVRTTGRLAALATFVLAIAPGPLLAQGATGKLEGVVRDSLSGRPVAEARLTILGTAFGALTDSNGYYFINGIPAGSYDMRATAAGARGVELRGVRIRSGHTITQNVTLPTAIEVRFAVPTPAHRIPAPAAKPRLPPGQDHQEHQLIRGAYTDRMPDPGAAGRGVLRGTVRDDQHRVVPLARVMIVGTTWAVLADSLGRYAFDSLQAGRYDIRAARPGYRATEIRGLRVMSRQTVTQDVTLEEVEVEIADPLFRRIH